MKRYLISFAYDATNYFGYQHQPHLITVQQKIEESLTSINSNKLIKIYAASRTDRGVHALNQKAHFDMDLNISLIKLKQALNSKLPSDIHVNSVKKVQEDFHARYHVVKKEYIYIINMGEYNPLERNYVYQYNKDLDVNKMREGLSYLIGTHDFKAFASAEDLKDNTVRTILKATLKKDKKKIYISFTGTGFLKYQVRSMVGTLIEVGVGKREPIDIKKIIDAKDRHKVGKTAKPEGLILKDIWYK